LLQERQEEEFARLTETGEDFRLSGRITEQFDHTGTDLIDEKTPIGPTNKGFQLLLKMGWKKDTGCVLITLLSIFNRVTFLNTIIGFIHSVTYRVVATFC
jgi:hypothetical protein